MTIVSTPDTNKHLPGWIKVMCTREPGPYGALYPVLVKTKDKENPNLPDAKDIQPGKNLRVHQLILGPNPPANGFSGIFIGYLK